MIGLALLFETRSSLPGCFIANQIPGPCYCKEQVAIYRMKDWKEETDRILRPSRLNPGSCCLKFAGSVRLTALSSQGLGLSASLTFNGKYTSPSFS